MLAMFILGRDFCITGFGKALCQQQPTLTGYKVKAAVLHGEERKLKISFVIVKAEREPLE